MGGWSGFALPSPAQPPRLPARSGFFHHRRTPPETALKIQLIHPPVYLNVYAMTALRPSLPLGLAYIAAALKDKGAVENLVMALDSESRGVRTYAMRALVVITGERPGGAEEDWRRWWRERAAATSP